MRAIGIDVRRYAWCHGRALWLLGLEAAQMLEDLEGAAADDQRGLARYVLRTIGEECAVMLALVLRHAKPMPPPHLRAAWAIELLGDHELAPECLWALNGIDQDEPLDDVAARCRRLVARVRSSVGQVPDPLTPEGYHPALALARDWLKLAEAVGEEGFLPREWMKDG
jgi:hypothetical protein